MNKDIWNKCHSSVCLICYYNAGGEKIASGTVFKLRDFLITNNHVYAGALVSNSISVTFVSGDGNTIAVAKTFTANQFQAKLIEGDTEAGWDYAVVKLDDAEFKEIPTLQMESEFNVEIGHPIVVLGFPFDGHNLSMSQGIISSRFTKADVKYIQLDANVNQGNSGGPLINLENGRVIGIVTRKATGLTQAFDKLELTLEQNIKVAQSVLGSGFSMVVAGFNPVQGILATQVQMKATANEIRRSANVGIGYAYELDKITEFISRQSE